MKFTYIDWPSICPHISSDDPNNPMTPIIKCLLSHRNTAPCEKCKGLRQCPSCTTEFKIQISRSGAAGHILETTYWKNFGAGRSVDDPKWAQHLAFPDITGFHAAKFSPGSIQSAFESEKHKIQRKIPLSHSKRVLGRVCVASS